MDLACHIHYRIDNQAGYALVYAPTSIDGLLMWLETVPPSAGVKAIVRVLTAKERH